ncbi:nitrate- and nitrite sensing domain-containing protein [Streptomyces sp. TRM 70361]|uniref:sensor histidine kinase n=1 Tax=Streptomyces sp. TRM 70361 TaxID=3116553 RepID=UPI002E7AF853|nr:nitrate- and nitrite sensing domain-containing protein [Streptomyces sp. TRM 70361]MEE1943161.1 nitrate- and nitrite sensing domain-containing protein [Streptomyces sp. TRM 70361]
MRFRGKSIRRKIVALLLVPLVALTSIWTFATVITSREADQLLEVSAVLEELGGPVQETVRTVQRERRRALVHLADPRSADSLTALREGQRATDAAVAALRGHAAGERVRDGLAEDSRERLDDLLEDLDRLRRLRAQVLENTAERRDAYEIYNAVVDSCHAFVATLRAVDDTRLDGEGRAVIGLSLAREHLAREDALLAAALAAGRMTGEELRAFSDRVAERELTYRTHLPLLPADDRDEHRAFWSGSDGRTLRTAEDRIIAAGAPAAVGAVNAERWRKNVTGVLEELRRLEGKAVDRHHRRVAPEATAVLVRAGVAGILGFAAVLLSVIVSFRVGRGLIRDLGALRREANEAAGVRLPGVMRRLAAGERVDAGTEVPRLEYGRDEMGQVGQALNTLQRAAVEAAVRQADMRRGVSEVFVNLARRSQVLLHRQLTLLDAMERRTDDPEVLSDLFRLDHLTTRMRRHAEGLVILSGAAPSRQWRRPIPLMDVVRAAVSEVEDYDRVEVRRLPRLAVDGAAIADLTHLIAELLENATVFSPPHTAVQVLGERVPSGFALEIHDRGLGMPPEALLEANLRLAETSDFQLSDTDRLGLFVVSRLARRRGVRVSLQPSPYGGTTAVVLIPGALLTAPEQAGRDGGTGELRAGEAGNTARTAAGLPLRGARPVLGTVRDGPVELEVPVGEATEPVGTAGTGAFPREHSRPSAPAAGRFPPRPSPDTEHGCPAEAGATPGEPDPATAGGLPRRVRQESLVRELRPRPRQRVAGERGEREGGQRWRDAAEVRDRMGSLQRGLRHGRRRNAGLPDGTGPDGRGTRTGEPDDTRANGTGDGTVRGPGEPVRPPGPGGTPS